MDPGAVVLDRRCGNRRHCGERPVGINEVEFADVYLPFAQAPAPSIEFVLRTGIPLIDLREQVQRAIAIADPAIPVTSLSTFEDRVDRVLQSDRFNALLFATFAGLAILLAVVGIHAAIAYAVAGKTKEFGVRLALGAHPAQLVRTTLLQSGRIGLAGGVLGIVATLAIAHVIGNAWYLVPGSHTGLLFGVTTTDPISLVGSFLGIIVVALVATAIPARRVGAVDPVRALRSDWDMVRAALTLLTMLRGVQCVSARTTAAVRAAPPMATRK